MAIALSSCSPLSPGNLGPTYNNFKNLYDCTYLITSHSRDLPLDVPQRKLCVRWYSLSRRKPLNGDNDLSCSCSRGCRFDCWQLGRVKQPCPGWLSHRFALLPSARSKPRPWLYPIFSDHPSCQFHPRGSLRDFRDSWSSSGYNLLFLAWKSNHKHGLK